MLRFHRGAINNPNWQGFGMSKNNGHNDIDSDNGVDLREMKRRQVDIIRQIDDEALRRKTTWQTLCTIAGIANGVMGIISILVYIIQTIRGM